MDTVKIAILVLLIVAFVVLAIVAAGQDSIAYDQCRALGYTRHWVAGIRHFTDRDNVYCLEMTDLTLDELIARAAQK